MQNRLRPSDIKPTRERLKGEQRGLCALCGLEIKDSGALDHDHATGKVRSVLHMSCNWMLGKVEKAAKRTHDPKAWLDNLSEYIGLHRDHPGEVIHPSFLTRDEKKDKLKKRYLRRKKTRL